MFANAIDKISGFTRPVKFITRILKSKTVIPGNATLFFVNEEGYAITCKHVANEIINADKINKNFYAFKEALSQIPPNKLQSSTVKKLERDYNLKPDSVAQMKVQFPGCIDGFTEMNITVHPEHDVAIIHFAGFENTLYKGHAVFAKNSKAVRPGDTLCRLGFPFPEFTDFKYDEATNDIDWNSSGNANTPQFPIDGMFTRHIGDGNGNITGIEISTPGLRGQSGGPLFDENGIIFGMQSLTNHLHLGFDMVNEKMMVNGVEKTINNQPFLHVGHCVHVDIIKAFLNEHHIKYYVSNGTETEEAVNG